MSRPTEQTRRAKKKRFWRPHLQAWQRSSLTQVEYCRRNALPIHRFRYWKTIIGRELENSEQATYFVPVPLASIKEEPPSLARKCYSGLTIRLDSGHHIELADDFNPATLEKAIVVLGGRL